MGMRKKYTYEQKHFRVYLNSNGSLVEVGVYPSLDAARKVAESLKNGWERIGRYVVLKIKERKGSKEEA